MSALRTTCIRIAAIDVFWNFSETVISMVLLLFCQSFVAFT